MVATCLGQKALYTQISTEKPGKLNTQLVCQWNQVLSCSTWNARNDAKVLQPGDPLQPDEAGSREFPRIYLSKTFSPES